MAETIGKYVPDPATPDELVDFLQARLTPYGHENKYRKLTDLREPGETTDNISFLSFKSRVTQLIYEGEPGTYGVRSERGFEDFGDNYRLLTQTRIAFGLHQIPIAEEKQYHLEWSGGSKHVYLPKAEYTIHGWYFHNLDRRLVPISISATRFEGPEEPVDIFKFSYNNEICDISVGKHPWGSKPQKNLATQLGI